MAHILPGPDPTKNMCFGHASARHDTISQREDGAVGSERKEREREIETLFSTCFTKMAKNIAKAKSNVHTLKFNRKDRLSQTDRPFFFAFESIKYKKCQGATHI